MNNVLPCRIVTIYAFLGDRKRAFFGPFLKALAEERAGRDAGPSALDCLLYTGHTGVSMNSGSNIYGFNPSPSHHPIWRLLDDLKNGEAFPGIVSDDTSVFNAARQRGLGIRSFQVLFPDKEFEAFQTNLDRERNRSQFTYGFPDGNGDCNCVTWMERLGVPLLTGRMSEFIDLPGIAAHPSRRFGECI